jgi:hypothetical protein
MQKYTEFEWTPQKEEAALLLAEDDLTDQEIADQLGCHRQTLALWKRHAAFTDRIKVIRKKIGDRLERYAIARKPRRVKALQERIDKMQRVIDQRSEEYQTNPELINVPGGDTGLLVRKITSIGAGVNFQRVDEHPVDTALLKEMREVEKQAAVECGQLLGQTEIELLARLEERQRELDEIRAALAKRAGW